MTQRTLHLIRTQADYRAALRQAKAFVLETAVDRLRSSPKPRGCWRLWLRWRSPNR